MEKTVIWIIVTIPLVYSIQNLQRDPQKFSFPPGPPLKPGIAESVGCFLPNESSTKYSVYFYTVRSSIYVLCYDKFSNIPLQSAHRLSPPVSEQVTTSPYLTDKFSTNLNQIPSSFYDCSSQVNNFRNSLGLQDETGRFINCNAGLYFTPSNLVPASDFPFEPQRIATQYFINTFPQWKRIKEGNWNNLEMSIRKYANNVQRPLTITGGTLGVTTLPDNTGHKQPVYMTRDIADNPSVPAPRLLWKLVYDSLRFESIVFVTVNNPHRGDIVDLYRNNEVVCNCVCENTEGWFDGWNRSDFGQGYIYCCTWEEFAQKVGIKGLGKVPLLRQKK